MQALKFLQIPLLIKKDNGGFFKKLLDQPDMGDNGLARAMERASE